MSWFTKSLMLGLIKGISNKKDADVIKEVIQNNHKDGSLTPSEYKEVMRVMKNRIADLKKKGKYKEYYKERLSNLKEAVR